ncbi:MAG: exonuclease SbcCD subunit D [Nanoarchaeota archaeon]|nr:exonuclease SbcCD subunit D [Nanoarchaeota archaeon]
MRFVHFADCHIDGYKDLRLAKLGHDNFKYVIGFALEKEVDFVLLAGDLFNTALPRVDALKFVTAQLKRLSMAKIPVYIIPGSHDYSPHGRTMLDVLELAGLVINVAKGELTEKGDLKLEFTKDPKTNVLITGIMGRAGMLDQQQYRKIDTTDIPVGKKIFMFHTAIQELKTPKLESMDASPLDLLPSGFTYYAGGHVHIVNKFSSERYKDVVYPGPTFPNSFSELDDLRRGSFVYYDNDDFEHLFIPSKEVVSLKVDCSGLTSEEAHEKISLAIEKETLDQAIVLIRLFGTVEGKTSDMDMKSLVERCYDKGAYIVLKNTNKLYSKLFEELTASSVAHQDVEKETIEEHLGQLPFSGDEKRCIKELLQSLDKEQADGEKKTVFQERMVDLAQHILEQ